MSFLVSHPISEFTEVTNQEEMDAFLEWIGFFHDGVLKEFHAVNHASVKQSLMMSILASWNMRMLLQRQFRNPSAVEIIFCQVQSFSTSAPESVDIYEGAGTVVIQKTDEQRVISLDIDGNKISCYQLFYRDASEWMGSESRFGEEIIAKPNLPIHQIGDGWVQCERCGNSWQTEGRHQVKCYRCDYN